MGLLRDRNIFANLRLTSVSSSTVNCCSSALISYIDASDEGVLWKHWLEESRAGDSRMPPRIIGRQSEHHLRSSPVPSLEITMDQ